MARFRKFFPVAALFAVATLCHAETAFARSAELRDHPSPYLALHADDPVSWREWGPAAIDAARAGDRLLFLSIGYFACHWCHVMQRESFQDEAIAARLNASFVPVKIDRELETALDARLVEFAEATLGRAGWPLNVFVTPDGYPLFAVLYAPPAQFSQVLERLEQMWNAERERLRGLARRVAAGDLPDPYRVVDDAAVEDLNRAFLQQARALHDEFEGGFGNQNKFPQAPALDYLIEFAARGEGAAVPVLESTLDAMARGGLYDHVGGGFFRYVVDPSWNIPHFEKMLYDNAQLARVYLRADGVLPGRGYGALARATLDFMRRDMAVASGGMLASLSAVDGNGVEGGYYLFEDDELAALLDADALRVVRAACDARVAPAL
ncbi:MAG: thioredoxin domain-containing protein, partial [Proteobacteria bacterium]